VLIGLPAGRAAEGRLEALAELGTDRALPFAADITVTGSNEAMANAAVERFGSLDVLVCNAGISLLKPFEAVTINERREVMTADLDTCFLEVLGGMIHEYEQAA
jgi:NAD(P)-dependent dehydrogenase (short-subunit alcohol dehydrogenase family)